MRTGDVIKFGSSSRLYVFSGPEEMIRPEIETEALRKKREFVSIAVSYFFPRMFLNPSLWPTK